MLGKTNMVYTKAGETAAIALNQDFISTPSSADIYKIEHINGIYFAFTGDDKVLYGVDAADLTLLQNNGSALKASHVVYINKKYYFTLVSMINFIIYETEDFLTYNKIEIADYLSAGIYKTSKETIVLLALHKYGSVNSVETYSFYIAEYEDASNLDVNETDFIKTESKIILDNQVYVYLRRGNMMNDKVSFKFYYHASTTNSEYYNKYCILTFSPDGNMAMSNDLGKNVLEHVYFVNNYWIYANESKFYFSINGVNFNLIGTVEKTIEVIFITGYDDGQIGIFYVEDDINKFTVANSRIDIISAFDKGIEVENVASLYWGCNDGEYTYIGCSGGIIAETYVDYSGSSASPGIQVLKTLSAKQALKESKAYTDEKYAALEARIAVLESVIASE